MNDFEAFTQYLTNKRIEINAMRTIITDFEDGLRESDKKLLLGSYIVLTYAYWESCYHRLERLLYLEFESVEINKLPYTLKAGIYRILALSAAGNNRNCLINEIKSYTIVEDMHKNMHDYDNLTIKFLLQRNENLKNDIDKLFAVGTMNPKLEEVKELLSKYNISLRKVLDNGEIPKYFEQGIAFIVEQRNIFAHQNDGIIFNNAHYDTYDECFEVFKLLNEGKPDMDSALSFVNDMGLNINIFYSSVRDVLMDLKNDQNN